MKQTRILAAHKVAGDFGGIAHVSPSEDLLANKSNQLLCLIIYVSFFFLN
jgi:hypothetical protein